MDFKEGDRVVVSTNSDLLSGKVGIIRVISGIFYGVVFDEYIGGHDLVRRCEYGYGYWLTKPYIRLININKRLN